MKFKICTDIPQSKKLLELGVDINTADMLWTYDFVVNDINGLNVISANFKPEENDIPAWSLSALLGIVPNGEKNDENYVDTESHSDFYICTYRNCWDGCIHSEYSEENLIDAVFGMVRWLLENKKI